MGSLINVEKRSANSDSPANIDVDEMKSNAFFSHPMKLPGMLKNKKEKG